MRRLRMYLPGMPAQVVQRGTIEPPAFRTRRYLLDLKELAVAARRYEVEIHAYPLGSDSVIAFELKSRRACSVASASRDWGAVADP